MKRQRKRRALFPKDPPSGEFGLLRGDISHPMPQGNSQLRYQVIQGAPSSKFVLKPVAKQERRILRWFTPELFKKANGRYYHKGDKKYYPLIDTRSSNPFRRYVYIRRRIVYKRHYTAVSRSTVKPYYRLTVDMVKSDRVQLGYQGMDTSLTFFPFDFARIEEVYLEHISLLDKLNPLKELGKVRLKDGRLWPYFSEFSEDDLGLNRVYLFKTRVEAYKAFRSGSNFIETETYDIIEGESPYYPFRDISGVARGSVMTHHFILYDANDNELFSLRDINRMFLHTGAQPAELIVPDKYQGLSIAGVTGPKDFWKCFDPTMLWLHFDHFDYSSHLTIGRNLYKSVNFLDLIGLVGYERILSAPLRGTPSLAQFLGEMPETVKSFAGVFETLLKMCRALKKGDLPKALKALEIGQRFLSPKGVTAVDVAKAGASVDLFYKFGILPFLEDLRALNDLGQLFGDFLNGAGVQRRVRHNFKDMPWASQPLSKKFEFSFQKDLGGVLVSGTSKINGTLVIDSEYGGQVLVKSPIAFLAEAVGLTNILSTAWELVPLSFVIDWFVDVGGVINVLFDPRGETFSVVEQYVTRVTTGSFYETVEITHLDMEELEQPLTLKNEYKVTETVRGYFDPHNARQTALRLLGDGADLKGQLMLLKLFKPTSTNDIINLQRLSTMGELLVQRLRGKK